MSSLVVKVKIHAQQVSLVDAHEFGHESLEVEDDLGPISDAVFVEGAPLYDFGLQAVVELWHELESECLAGSG